VIDVGGAAEFAEGTVTLRRAGNQEVGVVRWADELYAVRNVCPHQSGPVCEGQLLPSLTAPKPGVRSLARDPAQPVLACPWHGWEFELDTGSAVWNPCYRLRTYAIEVRDGRVLVDTQRRALPRAR
jgi:nitrite reductase/ring-hydroxylating ferredoxin subunit